MCRMLKWRASISFFVVFSARASSAETLAGGCVSMARLVRSTFLRTSFATMKEPILACLAKKTITLSLATLIRMLPLLALVTVSEINYPIIKCRSRADRWEASDPTMNLSKLRASRYNSVFSSLSSSLSRVCMGSTISLACSDETVANFFYKIFLISTIAFRRFFGLGSLSSFNSSSFPSTSCLIDGMLAKLSDSCTTVRARSASARSSALIPNDCEVMLARSGSFYL